MSRFYRVLQIVICTTILLMGCQPEEQIRRTPTLTPIMTAVSATSTAVSPTSTAVPTIPVMPSPTEMVAVSTATAVPTQTPLPSATPPAPTPTTNPVPILPANLPGPVDVSQSFNQIGGSINAVKVVDNIAYVGVGPRLYVLDVSDPQNITVLGVSNILPGIISELIVEGEVVFALTEQMGVWLVNVSTPTTPMPLAHIPTIGEGQFITVYKDYLLILEQNIARDEEPFAELTGFDISDRQNPVERFEMTLPNEVDSLTFNEDYLYLSIADTWETSDPGLLILDGGTLPQLETAAFVTEFPRSSEMLIEDGVLYGWVFGEGLISYDLSMPLNPERIHHSGSYLPITNGLGITEDALFAIEYLCDGGACGGYLVIHPLINQQSEQYDFLSTDGGYRPRDLATWEKNVFIADGSQLIVYDVNDVFVPRLAGLWTSIGNTSLVRVDDGLLYALDNSEYRLSVFELGTAVLPSWLFSEPYQNRSSDSRLDLTFSDEYAFWSGFYNGIVVANKTNLEQIVSFQNPIVFEQYAHTVVYNDAGYLYALFRGQLVFVDVNEPTEPVLIYPPQWPTESEESYETIYWQEPYLYALDTNGRLSVIDETDPANPVEVSALDIGQPGCELAVQGRVIYVLVGSCYRPNGGELVVVDAGVVEAMRIVGRTAVPGSMLDLALGDSFVYVANGNVLVIDVHQSSLPQLFDTIPTPGMAQDVLVYNGRVYAADGDGGVIILEE